MGGLVHNIWADKYHHLKAQFAGEREIFEGKAAGIIERLARYDRNDTDLARMMVETVLERAIVASGIWSDASWHAGRARLAVVRVHGGSIDLRVRETTTPDSFQAEMAALAMALELFPGDELIHTDNQSAAKRDPRFRWIPRKLNATADAFTRWENKHAKDETKAPRQAPAGEAGNAPGGLGGLPEVGRPADDGGVADRIDGDVLPPGDGAGQGNDVPAADVPPLLRQP